MRPIIGLLCTAAAATAPLASTFQLATSPSLSSVAFHKTTRAGSVLLQESIGTSENKDIESYLSARYPEFLTLLSQNKKLWKSVKESNAPYTLFAPNSQAFADLGEKKRMQMKDDRNLESVEKMGAFHVILDEAIAEETLLVEDWTAPKPLDGSPRPLKLGAILTSGGEVRVGRSKSGGFFGFGAKEDGKICLGSDARIVNSEFVGDSIVHEVDTFISPEILWRFFDQLRIPGV